MIINALQNVKNKVEETLINAGFVNGLNADITNETSVMFWYTILKNTEASKKNKFIVWDYNEINKEYGDGEAELYNFRILITLYSKVTDNYVELTAIENEFVDTGYSLFLNNTSYNSERQMYSFEFAITGIING